MFRAALALCLILLLTFNAAASIKSKTFWWENAPQPIINGQTCPKTWWDAAILTSKHHDCSPFDIIAVMRMESGPGCFLYGGEAVGRGRNGRKYIRPMGFNRHCNIPYEYMYIPEKQIYWAGMILSGNLKSRLKHYNKEWYKNNYIRDVVNLSRKLENEAFEQIRLQKYGF
jgi:hypothetical protein